MQGLAACENLLKYGQNLFATEYYFALLVLGWTASTNRRETEDAQAYEALVMKYLAIKKDK